MQTRSEIQKYWDRKAETLKADPSATMKDVILRNLEIEAVVARLRATDTLLDVGCGNAFGSIAFAPHCRRVLAVDRSESMIAMANALIAQQRLTNIAAETADVLALDDRYAQRFSAATSVRCLINLETTSQQYSAIQQLATAVQPGGRLFLIEGVAEHFAALNEARAMVGLPAIQLHWHNRLFNKADLENELRKYFSIDEVVDFGEYYFISRIVHPLYCAPADPQFDGRLNSVARTVWQRRVVSGTFAKLSTLMLYVCSR